MAEAGFVAPGETARMAATHAPGSSSSPDCFWARIAATLIVLIVGAGCSRAPLVAIVAPNGEELAVVRAEIADSGESRELGLMYRSHLNDQAGMLFVFPSAAPQVFWMKNTIIPLDMIFAGDDRRIVGIVANAEPYSTRRLDVNAPSRYVLEVKGGFCRNHGITAGDRLRFIGFNPHAKD